MTFKGSLPVQEESEEHVSVAGPRWEKKDVLGTDEKVKALILEPCAQLVLYRQLLIPCSCNTCIYH